TPTKNPKECGGISVIYFSGKFGYWELSRFHHDREVMEKIRSHEGTHYFRVEDRTYSIADDWGDHSHTGYAIRVQSFPILRRTPKGVWIETDDESGKRFILETANKRFALPTLEDALISYCKRKDRQASIYQARAHAADTMN